MGVIHSVVSKLRFELLSLGGFKESWAGHDNSVIGTIFQDQLIAFAIIC